VIRSNPRRAIRPGHSFPEIIRNIVRWDSIPLALRSTRSTNCRHWAAKLKNYVLAPGVCELIARHSRAFARARNCSDLEGRERISFPFPKTGERRASVFVPMTMVLGEIADEIEWIGSGAPHLRLWMTALPRAAVMAR
jgi:hypothetical protein